MNQFPLCSGCNTNHHCLQECPKLILDLVDQLEKAGSMGLDGSPGDILCKMAAERIKELEGGQPHTYHYCEGGKIRPYCSLVCSSHRGHPNYVRDFNPLEELNKLIKQIDSMAHSS